MILVWRQPLNGWLRIATADRITLGFGLFSLKDRLLRLGGNLTIDSTPGEGTVVRLSVPLNAMTQASPSAKYSLPHEADFVASSPRGHLPIDSGSLLIMKTVCFNQFPGQHTAIRLKS